MTHRMWYRVCATAFCPLKALDVEDLGDDVFVLMIGKVILAL